MKKKNGMRVIINSCGLNNRQDTGLLNNYIRKCMVGADIVGVRIGVETCSRSLDFIQEEETAAQIWKLKKEGLRVYFVFPDVCQSQWEKAEKLLDVCTGEGIDGIVVNDFGMLATANHVVPGKVILGRQFDKRMRDPRTGTLWEENAVLEQPGIASDEYISLFEREKLQVAEVECFGSISDIPQAWEIWIHTPYLLLSHGRICEFGGIGRAQEDRFLINHCQAQCRKCNGTGFSPYLEGVLYQRQNALYTTVHKDNLTRLAGEHANFVAVVYIDNYRDIWQEKDDTNYGTC